MIDLRRLEILRELERCGTIAATATAVHLTASAVSQQLAALSKEAGTPMLEPDGRRVRLTAAAQLLLTHAHAIFTQLEHAESDLASFRRGDAGTVRLGSFSSGIGAIGVPAMERLAEQSRLRMQIHEIESDTMADALLGRTVDVGLSLSSGERLPEDDDARLAVEHLMDDPLDVALPADHRMAGHQEIDLAELADEDWVLNLPGVHCWQVAMRACAQAGFSPRVRHYADEFTGVVALIRAHTGVGFIPRLAQYQLPPAPIVIRPIARQKPVRQIGIRYRAGTASQPHIAPVLKVVRARISELVRSGPRLVETLGLPA